MAQVQVNLIDAVKQVNGVRVICVVPQFNPNHTFDIFVPNGDGDAVPTRNECIAAVQAKMQIFYDRKRASQEYKTTVLNNITSFNIDITK